MVVTAVVEAQVARVRSGGSAATGRIAASRAWRDMAGKAGGGIRRGKGVGRVEAMGKAQVAAALTAWLRLLLANGLIERICRECGRGRPANEVVNDDGTGRYVCMTRR